jgi:hypothetical protein
MALTQVDAGLLNSTAQYYAYKNRYINGDFYIWQRGTSFSNPASGAFTYTSDRWGTFVSGTGSTATVSQQATTPGTFTSEPVEPAYFLRYAVTVAGSVTYRDFAQRIEDVLQTAGKTVTLSFYAKASSTVSVTPYWYQNFGTGGSGDVSANGTAFNIGTSWTKYTTTLTIGSASGKTIGPPNTSWCAIGLILPSTTLQIDFALMQVELGSTATSFDYRPYTTELQLCQRYYYKNPMLVGTGYSNYVARATGAHPVTMRTDPTVTVANTTNFFNGSAGIYANGTLGNYSTPNYVNADIQTTTNPGAGTCNAIVPAGSNITVSAEL